MHRKVLMFVHLTQPTLRKVSVGRILFPQPRANLRAAKRSSLVRQVAVGDRARAVRLSCARRLIPSHPPSPSPSGVAAGCCCRCCLAGQVRLPAADAQAARARPPPHGRLQQRAPLGAARAAARGVYALLPGRAHRRAPHVVRARHLVRPPNHPTTPRSSGVFKRRASRDGSYIYLRFCKKFKILHIDDPLGAAVRPEGDEYVPVLQKGTTLHRFHAVCCRVLVRGVQGRWGHPDSRPEEAIQTESRARFGNCVRNTLESRELRRIYIALGLKRRVSSSQLKRSLDGFASIRKRTTSVCRNSQSTGRNLSLSMYIQDLFCARKSPSLSTRGVLECKLSVRNLPSVRPCTYSCFATVCCSPRRAASLNRLPAFPAPEAEPHAPCLASTRACDWEHERRAPRRVFLLLVSFFAPAA